MENIGRTESRQHMTSGLQPHIAWNGRSEPVDGQYGDQPVLLDARHILKERLEAASAVAALHSQHLQCVKRTALSLGEPH